MTPFLRHPCAPAQLLLRLAVRSFTATSKCSEVMTLAAQASINASLLLSSPRVTKRWFAVCVWPPSASCAINSEPQNSFFLKKGRVVVDEKQHKSTGSNFSNMTLKLRIRLGLTSLLKLAQGIMPTASWERCANCQTSRSSAVSAPGVRCEPNFR